MSYAFAFDASACSGCKACQQACKDKNNLPVGMLFRRVIEVSGGGWQQSGAAWQSTVFAYYLSLACNHCTHPKCAGVCPTDAYIVRPDGIVFIDASKCMGCDYCSWACPYGAPQYDRGRGVMTKCDFCYDRLDAGLSPSCVAACPLRVLNYEPLEGAIAGEHRLNLWQLPATLHPYPLPEYARTEPHLAIKPHTGMSSPLEKAVSNQEEVQPLKNKHRIAAAHELPLVAFTLLAQMAAGMAIFSLALSPLPLPLLLAIGILLGAGGLMSFLHLGRKRNAWRAVMHLKKSWLSREILMAGLFGAAWAVSAGFQAWGKASLPAWLMALLGLGLIYSMAQVYRLRAVTAWNSWRTFISFLLSAVVLGALGVNFAGPHPGWAIIAGAGMLAELVLRLSAQSTGLAVVGNLRVALLSLGVVGTLALALVQQANQAWLAVPVFLVVLVGEIIGRWQFYAARVPFLSRANYA